MKTVRYIVQVLLLGAILALVYVIYAGVMKPIDFEKAKTDRFNTVVQKLKDIRTAQIAYKSVYGKFTGSFDTLIYFVKNDSFPMIYAEGSEDDSLAVAKGLVIREVYYLPVRDSLFPDHYPVDSLRYVPYTTGIQFELKAGSILTASQVEVQVFEASAKNFDILNGLDRQLIVNLNDKMRDFDGLRVGNITEANNNAGNWE